MSAFDKVIIGAGFYGLYSAVYCGKIGQSVLVLEKEKEAFSRASYINQARVHMGYHYPRSISTAQRSARYFDRFCNEFGFCIENNFKQIYATSGRLSWTNESDFKTFCDNAGIPCFKTDADRYFKQGVCDGAFETTEYSYDAQILKGWLLKEIDELPNVRIKYDCHLKQIFRKGDIWKIETLDLRIETPYILNAAYAGVNEVLKITDGGGV